MCRRYLVSQHPEVEQRILEELAQHQLMAGPHGSARDIQYEDLGRLTYLNCVIKVSPVKQVAASLTGDVGLFYQWSVL